MELVHVLGSSAVHPVAVYRDAGDGDFEARAGVAKVLEGPPGQHRLLLFQRQPGCKVLSCGSR